MFAKLAASKAITNANFNPGKLVLLHTLAFLKLWVDGLMHNTLFLFSHVGEWWATYGLQTPTLMHMALRIHNLTTSSSGCERNWSVFEQVTLESQLVVIQI